MIERKIGKRHTLVGHVIRGASSKTYGEIHQESRAVPSARVPPYGGRSRRFDVALASARPLSNWFKPFLRMANRCDPAISPSMQGTVGIAAVAMFGKGQEGRGIVPSP